MIRAHDGPLVAMSFDMSGSRIATASVRVRSRRIKISQLYQNMDFL